MQALSNAQPLPQRYWLLFALAALSFLPTLRFYYVGEEAIFPIISHEMWQSGTWLKQYLFGVDQMHNPLFNWLIMPFSALAGWEHVLTVTRILAIAATLLTALTLAWLAQRLFRDRIFAAFAALAYLTMADVLLYHGWLGYVDPLFAMFIFAAISTLWVGVHEQRVGLVAMAGILLTCAFLSKALTAYIFFGTAVFVLLFNARQRSFLLRWPVLLILTATFIAPKIWYGFIPSGHSQGNRMFAEILYKMDFQGVSDYLLRLVAYPVEILVWLSPVAGLALYFVLRKRGWKGAGEEHRLFMVACWMLLLCFLPYWLSPKGGMRYLMPIFPLLGLMCARIIWLSGEAARATTRKWIVGAIIFKLVVALAIFPYYQHVYRGENYALAARDILQRTQGHPLYITDSSSAGLSIGGYINIARPDQAAIVAPPPDWKDGFVVALVADAELGQVSQRYQLAAEERFLLCRGSACAQDTTP